MKDCIKREGLPGDVELALSLSSLTSLSNIYGVDKRLADMDEMGIDVQAVCINPFWYWADPDLARKIVRIQNEKIAALCSAHPDRFVGLGSVALQHPSLAVEQLEEGVKKLGMRGFAIGGSVNGQELSDPKFHPIWAKAEQLEALIFIHPQGFSGTGGSPTRGRRAAVPRKRAIGQRDRAAIGNYPRAYPFDSRGNAGSFPEPKALRCAWRRISAILF